MGKGGGGGEHGVYRYARSQKMNTDVNYVTSVFRENVAEKNQSKTQNDISNKSIRIFLCRKEKKKEGSLSLAYVFKSGKAFHLTLNHKMNGKNYKNHCYTSNYFISFCTYIYPSTIYLIL